MSETFSVPRRVYHNGGLVDADSAGLSLNDRGVLFGIGFYETFRTSGGRPHLWSLHRERLARACAFAGLSLPDRFLVRNEERLREVVRELLREHGGADAVFRYTVTAGAGEPAEFLVPRAFPPTPPAEGIALRVLKLRRDSGEWLPRPKSVSSINAYLGGEELRRRAAAPTDDGLFLARESGCVVETTRQNVAWISDGVLCYPDGALGAIGGTGLEWILSLGVPARPVRARVDEVCAADAILTVNSVRGITPVHTVWDVDDKTALGVRESHRNPLVVSLRRQWEDSLAATAGV